MKGSCIDLILKSRPSLHQFTNIRETGIQFDLSPEKTSLKKPSLIRVKDTLNYHAPIEISKYHGNTKSHVNTILRKEIMKSSNLKHKAKKLGKIEDNKH